MSGVLYGLGLGPGDPDLVTIKAAAVLRDVPIIVYVTPMRGNKSSVSLARSIAAPHLIGKKKEMPMPIAMLNDPTSYVDGAIYHSYRVVFSFVLILLLVEWKGRREG